MNHGPRKRQQGFTLAELIITVGVAALIAGYGVPTFNQVIYNTKRLSAFQTLYGSLQAARGEAISRSTPVTVCKRNSAGSACNTAAGGVWSNGWFVFVDLDGDGTIDGTDTIIRVFEDNGEDIHIEATAANVNQRVTFGTLGQTGNTGTLAICDPRGPGHAAGVVINAAGRVRAWINGTDTAFNATHCS